MKIDFSHYVIYFEDFCLEYHITFNSQKQADDYYNIWIKGFNWAAYVYY